MNINLGWLFALAVGLYLTGTYLEAQPDTVHGTLTCSIDGTLVYQRGPHTYLRDGEFWISIDTPAYVYRQPEGTDCAVLEDKP